jgi:hypothetical protein
MFGAAGTVDAGVVQTKAPEHAADLAQVDKIHECFLLGLSRLAREDSRFKITAFTEVYFLDQLPNDPAELSHASVDKVCKQFVDSYMSAYRQALAALSQDPRHKLTLGSAGTRPIDSQYSFLRFANKKRAASHIAGHSDIMTAAVRGLQGPPFDEDALDLLARAAQSPDLYQWTSDSYHAQTPDHDDTDRDAKVTEGQVAFLKLETGLLHEFHEATKSPASTERALLILGVACHVIQDLVYHRGMSLRQHAGLSFYLDADPDVPPAGERERRQAEATRYTTRLLTLARGLAGEHAWERLSSWQHPGGWSFFGLASEYFKKKNQDMTSPELVKYWALSLDYRLGRRKRTELDLAARGMWDTEKLLSEVEKTFRERH